MISAKDFAETFAGKRVYWKSHVNRIPKAGIAQTGIVIGHYTSTVMGILVVQVPPGMGHNGGAVFAHVSFTKQPDIAKDSLWYIYVSDVTEIEGVANIPGRDPNDLLG